MHTQNRCLLAYNFINAVTYIVLAKTQPLQSLLRVFYGIRVCVLYFYGFVVSVCVHRQCGLLTAFIDVSIAFVA